MISKIIVIIALLINSAQSEILRRKVNSIEEPSDVDYVAALETITPDFDPGESTTPQIGAMIGLEWEIRGIVVSVRHYAQT
jgi:hypothetical protein